MRVLIVKTSSLGDVVHAMPLISDIARVFAHVRIDWAVEESFADIPRLHPAVTRVLPLALRRWRRHALAWSSWRELLEARRQLRRARYHAVIDCQGLLKSAVVASWARGPVTGFAAASAREPPAALFYQHKIALASGLHAVERNRRLGAAALSYVLEGPVEFGLVARAGLLQVEPPFDDTGVVLLLTNASRASKLWPDDHWLALEHALARRGHRCRLAWGSLAEHDACERRVARMQAAQLLPRASIAQLSALTVRAALVVGLDTGLTHLAAALGAPTVGIFCDFDTARVGLCADQSGAARASAGCVLSLGGVGQVPAVADVLAAVDRVLAGSA